MKMHLGSFFLVIVIAISVSAPTQTSRPIPPGIREADKLPGPTDNLPPINQPSVVRPAPKLMREQAEELAGLAESIPADVNQFAGGLLPKDMNGKLKRIEKLSKELRGELLR